MKNLRLTLVFLLVVLISACIIVPPVAAQTLIPITASPDHLAFTLCYPNGEDSRQILLKNDNDISFSLQVFWQNIPYYTGVVVDPYSASMGPYSQLPVDVRVSSRPSGGGPSLPVGEYDGTIYFDFFPGGPISVPVHYSIVNCNPSPEFPSTFLPVTMIIGFLGAVLLIKRTREH